MKKEIFNILFLSAIALVVAWLYWPKGESTGRMLKDAPDSLVLALSWQPAFCEHKPNKPECRSQHARRYDASNFSLHGLWPQPRDNVYCGVPKHIIALDKRSRWNELPKLDIQGHVRKELSRRMPGYRSNLHRHEWYKHGTCLSKSAKPQAYYEVSMGMVDRINDSHLRDLFATNIGREITATQIVRAMEISLGKGAGNRISIACKRDGRRTLITEVKISYAFPKSDILLSPEEMNRLAPKLPIGCKRGIVDPVGLQ